MSKKLKKRLKKIIIGAVAFALAIAASCFLQDIVSLLLFLVAYAIIGGDVVKKAAQNILKGQIFDENFLMLIATVGAFFVGEYPEAVAVMLFYQIGEWFQSYAVNRSRKSIKDLMNIRPDYANLLKADETGALTVEEMVDPDAVAVGDLIVVKPGERIPLDGTVMEGNSTLDTMALTGESVPREVTVSEDVISGCVNLTGVLKVRVNRVFAESTVAKILDLVENASSKKAETENFITRFAKYYTPCVVIAAALLAILPPLILQQPFSEWLYRALSFLVISCPCALVISIPLSFFGGLGGASKVGILVKGSTYLETLSKTEIVVMDKTGTLTKGNFEVQKIVSAQKSMSEYELLELAALAESYSNHPISISIMNAYAAQMEQEQTMKGRVSQVEELSGHGVKAVIDGDEVYVGNEKLMNDRQILIADVSEFAGTIVHVAKKDCYCGYLLIADELKEDAQRCIQELKKAGIKRVVMLTGDRMAVAECIARKLGIKEYQAELLPADKVEQVEKLFEQKSEKGKLIFVGDGINDAPVLARADIGIAMGGLGQDAAIEAADIVIMTDEPSKIAQAMKISKKTLAIVKQNIVLALGIKLAVLVLAALGFASMWAAVFADVGVAFLAILNAMRAMKVDC